MHNPTDAELTGNLDKGGSSAQGNDTAGKTAESFGYGTTKGGSLEKGLVCQQEITETPDALGLGNSGPGQMKASPPKGSAGGGFRWG